MGKLRTEKSASVVLNLRPLAIPTRQGIELDKREAEAAEAEATHRAMMESSGDPESRGVHILAGIAKLKSICTHPVVLDEGEGTFAGRSGKLNQMELLLPEIRAGGEAVLIFTQFAAWLPRLAAHLAEVLGEAVLYYRGEMTPRQKQAVVDRFQDPSGPGIMCVSLLSGGVGLNLQRASHVIHLDHWWNPKAGDQAEGRAWRIGQTRPVVVHDLVCPGTIEDRIAVVAGEKRAIADSVTLPTRLDPTNWTEEELNAMVALNYSEVAA